MHDLENKSGNTPPIGRSAPRLEQIRCVSSDFTAPGHEKAAPLSKREALRGDGAWICARGKSRRFWLLPENAKSNLRTSEAETILLAKINMVFAVDRTCELPIITTMTIWYFKPIEFWSCDQKTLVAYIVGIVFGVVIGLMWSSRKRR